MDIEKNTFLLCFAAIIWKRIHICLVLYSEHNEIELCGENILKSLKYNLLAPTGLVSFLKPYLIKALTQGFLMPKEYTSNIYVTRAIRLFGDAYKICKIEDNDLRKKEQIQFINSYASSVYSSEKHHISLNQYEKKDCITCIEKFNKRNSIKRDILIQHCEFCKLMGIWDIDLSLISFEDPYQKLLTYMILLPLEQ